jgi:hypothetical protein
MRIRAPLILTTCTLMLLSWPATASAQRHGRPHHGGGGHGTVVVGVGGYYAPYYYYDPFYSPFWWGYPWPYYGALPPAYWGAGAYGGSAVRLQVTPRQAEVYVDGYLAGTVDDFDGTFQRLSLPPGEHEIVIYFAGYRTVRQKVYLTPGDTFRIRHTMEALAPGEPAEPRPVPPPPPPQQPAAPAAPAPAPPPVEPGALPPGSPIEPAQRFGSIALRVQPADADIYIDGESWQTSGAGDRLVVQVPEGTHRVEIRKDGYEAFTRTVAVRPGETVTLNVSLTRGGA